MKNNVYLCRCIVAITLPKRGSGPLCKDIVVEKDIVSDSEVIRKFEGPYQ
jgi:hypothetical protein